MEHLAIYEKVLKEVILATDSRDELFQAMQHNPASPYCDQHDHPVTDHIEAIKKNQAEVAAIIDEILRSDLTEGQRKQMEKYVTERTKYVNEGLNPACEAILAGEYHRANDILLNKAWPMCNVAIHEAESFGKVGIAEHTLGIVSLVFGGGMVAAAFWVWMQLA